MRRTLANAGTLACASLLGVLVLYELDLPPFAATASPGAPEASETAVPVEAQAARSMYGANYFTNRPVVSHNGETFRFYDDLIRDKIVVVNFIYTNCPDICPLTSARMAQVQERLGDAVGRDVFFLSISVDPEHDTPEVLKEYAEAFGAGPGWLFLTGEPEDVRVVRHALGDRRQALNEHTQEVRLGNDRTGEWQRAALLDDMETLMLAIRSMDPDWRREVRTVPFNPLSNTGIAIADDPAPRLFRRMCAPCHTVGVGDRVGPDLAGVTERRSEQWLKDYIMNPPRMRREGDPIALALREEYPNILMPFLGVLRTDAEELVTFLEAETARLAQMEEEHRANHDHSSHDHGGHSHDHGSHGDSDHDHDHGSHSPEGHDHSSHHDG
jgi:protein SCO1